jgi:hypothetical protein
MRTNINGVDPENDVGLFEVAYVVSSGRNFYYRPFVAIRPPPRPKVIMRVIST